MQRPVSPSVFARSIIRMIMRKAIRAVEADFRLLNQLLHPALEVAGVAEVQLAGNCVSVHRQATATVQVLHRAAGLGIIVGLRVAQRNVARPANGSAERAKKDPP